MAPNYVRKKSCYIDNYGLSLFFYFLLICVCVLSCFFYCPWKPSRRRKRSPTDKPKADSVSRRSRKTRQSMQSAKEQAERANEAKKSHLTGIKPWTTYAAAIELLVRPLLSEKQEYTAVGHQKGLTSIHPQWFVSVRLIEGLLDISKIEAGRDLYLQHGCGIFRTDRSLNSSCLIKRVTKASSIERPKILALAQQMVVTDEKRLRQILNQFCVNAGSTYAKRLDFGSKWTIRNQWRICHSRHRALVIKKRYVQAYFRSISNVYATSVQGIYPATWVGLDDCEACLTKVHGGDLQARSVARNGSEFRVSLMVRVGEPRGFVCLPMNTSAVVVTEGYQRTL